MRRNLSIALTSSLSIAALFVPKWAVAFDVGGWNIGIQPRLEAGFMYYDFEQEPGNIASRPGDPVQQNFTAGKLEVKDTLPMISGGLTLFVDRFFIDASVQYAFNGEDNNKQEFSELNEITQTDEQGNPIFGTSFESEVEASEVDFDRIDYAISAGYSVTDSFTIYAGYKQANTNMDLDRTGEIAIRETISGSRNDFLFLTSDKVDLDLEQYGPFIGATYGWRINGGFVDGLLSANLAVAFLDSRTDEKLRNRRTQQVNPETREPIDDPTQFRDDRLTLKGDTVGLTIGLSWRGFTPIDRLTYLISVQGYSYDFDGRTSLADYQEAVVTFRAGITYSF